MAESVENNEETELIENESPKQSNSGIKLLVFLAVGSSAFLGLELLDKGSVSWDVLLKSLEEPMRVVLKGLVSTATAGASSLLIPRFKKPGEPKKLKKPPETEDGVRAGDAVVSLVDYREVYDAYKAWKKFAEDLQKRSTLIEAAKGFLDTRQAVLRVSLYGMLGIAAMACLAAFLAPSISVTQGQRDPSAFSRHMGWVAGAYSVVGFVLGAVIHKIKVFTSTWNAGKAALISALVLNVSAFLLSLPYIYPSMSKEPTILLWGCNWQLLIWLAVFRLVMFPACAMLAALAGFKIVSFFSGDSAPLPPTP